MRNDAIFRLISTFDGHAWRLLMTDDNLAFMDSVSEFPDKGKMKTTRPSPDPFFVNLIKSLLKPFCRFNHKMTGCLGSRTPMECACVIANPLPVNKLRQGWRNVAPALKVVK